MNREWVRTWADWKDRSEEMFNELARIGQGAATPSFAFFRKTEKYRTNSKTNLSAVQAWCLQIANIAVDKPTPNTYRLGTVTPEFMREIAKLSVYDDGPRRAQKSLATAGINLVTEPHLPKTYLDGAALRLSDGKPVIGLTLRHDRLDNFWFTLMHELAHVGLHLEKGQDELFVDEFNFSQTESDSLEQEANDYASEALIPHHLWDSNDARLTESPLDAYHLSQEAGVHLAVVAGRIRYENDEYHKLSQFVGRGEVRVQFET